MAPRRKTKPSPQSAEPPRAQAWQPWAAAFLTAAVLATVLLHDPYRFRLVPIKNQLLQLPTRVGMDFNEIQTASTHGRDYLLVKRIERSTMEDATILVSSDPRDGKLSQPLFLAWFLYPRVILRRENMEAAPGTPVDFVVVTPNFNPDPDVPKVSGPSLVPVSPRAIKHFKDSR